eukprot:jgi/Ulvmu1/9333/UM050_0083.1
MGQLKAPDSGNAAPAQTDAAPPVAAPKISTKLMGLKFMQRAQAKKELSIQEKAAKKALEEERFQLETEQEAKCVVVVEEEMFSGSGRISFQNFNPDVEKINEEHQHRLQELEVDAAEKPDVSEAEMSNVLGKRKEVSSDGQTGNAPIAPLCAASLDTPKPELSSVPKKSSSATVVVELPGKSRSKQEKPAFRKASEGRVKKKGRVS